MKLYVNLLKSLFLLCVCCLSFVHAQEGVETVQMNEIARFGSGMTQDRVSYDRVVVSPTQEYIAVLSSEEIEVWELNTQSLVATLDAPFGDFGFGVFDWSPDGTQIATISIETELFIWDAFTGDLVQTISGVDIGSNGIRSIDWYKSDVITTGSFEYFAWNLNSEDLPNSFDCHPYGSHLWWSSNNEFVATMGGGSSLVWICDSQSNQILSFEGYTTVAWSPDNAEIATVGIYNTLRVWSLTNGEVLTTSDGGDNNILKISWHPVGDQIVTGHLNGEIRIWERLTPNVFWLIGESVIEGMTDVQWVENHIITVSNDGLIKIWETELQ